MTQNGKATLTISMPRTMKDFIRAKLEEGRFSTPSEYIRSLIREDQDATMLVAKADRQNAGDTA
jgi:Arc/MetJ-type ribon-helix-helix transcriptional regulator